MCGDTVLSLYDPFLPVLLPGDKTTVFSCCLSRWEANMASHILKVLATHATYISEQVILGLI